MFGDGCISICVWDESCLWDGLLGDQGQGLERGFYTPKHLDMKSSIQ